MGHRCRSSSGKDAKQVKDKTRGQSTSKCRIAEKKKLIVMSGHEIPCWSNEAKSW